MPNPRLKEFPLKHVFPVHFCLQEFESSHVHNSTLIPLWCADQAKTDVLAQAVQVNPNNDSFEDVVNTPMCFMNSRVNKIRIQEYCRVATGTDLPDQIYHKALFTFGLGDADTVAADGTTILSLLAMTKQADNLLPTYVAGTDLEHASLMHADVDTLDTSQSLEGVGLNEHVLKGRMHGELGPKIRKIVMGPYVNRVHKDYPYYSDRWYNAPPAARRMGPFTGCYLYVAMNPSTPDGAVSTLEGFSAHFDDELTIEEEDLMFHYRIEFNEYNDAFDQSP